jgi:N-acetylmuramoyl-L-alanine amidase CwlA
MVVKENRKYVNKNYNLNNYKRELDSIEKIIVHCTATDSTAWDNPMAVINYDLGPNHISRSGCPTATYHFYINKQGEAYQLVSMNIWTWNCAGENRDSVAVCINHGAVKDNVTPEQYNSLVECICYIFDILDWGYDAESVRERLFFHRDFNSMKSCPGKIDKGKLIESVIQNLAGYGDNV